MSRAISIVILLGISCLAGCSKTNSARNWQEYKSEKHKFSAEFPYTVQVEENQDRTSVHSNDSGEKVDFGIVASEFVAPDGKEAAWRELAEVRDSIAERLGGSIEDAKNMDVAGLPAIGFTLVMTDEGKQFRVYSRYVMSKDRLYRQSVTVQAGTNADKDVQTFFESFQVEKGTER